jgi:hypothetical protein
VILPNFSYISSNYSNCCLYSDREEEKKRPESELSVDLEGFEFSDSHLREAKSLHRGNHKHSVDTSLKFNESLQLSKTLIPELK